MTQVINHDLGHKIFHNPGYDFDLGYEKNLNFFITQVLNLLYTCVIQATRLRNRLMYFINLLGVTRKLMLLVNKKPRQMLGIYNYSPLRPHLEAV